MSHTPAPWIIKSARRADIEITTQDRKDRHIAPICEMETDFTGEIGTEQVANANLIASAPELLDALEFCTEMMVALGHNKGGCYENALRIIAKARNAG